MALTLTPQNPILKLHSADNRVEQTFKAVVVDTIPPNTVVRWTWSFISRDGITIGENGDQATTATEQGKAEVDVKVDAHRFTTPGRYMLSVTANYGDRPEESLGTQCSEMQVVPNNIDEENSFIACGADGNYYLVALSFNATEGSQNPGEKQVIQLVSIRANQSVIPEGFSPEDVGSPAPLARSIPKTVGAAFITCVMVNLQSKDNHKRALFSAQRKDATVDWLGSSSTKVQK